jgi:hypothetical protein
MQSGDLADNVRGVDFGHDWGDRMKAVDMPKPTNLVRARVLARGIARGCPETRTGRGCRPKRRKPAWHAAGYTGNASANRALAGDPPIMCTNYESFFSESEMTKSDNSVTFIRIEAFPAARVPYGSC